MRAFLSHLFSGWIKVYRSVLNFDFLFRKDEHFCRFGAFIYLLLSATIEDQTYNESGSHQYTLSAHSVRFSVQNLQDIFNWSPKEVRVFLEGLEKWGVIRRSTSPYGTVITFQDSPLYEITSTRKTGANTGASLTANTGANLYNNTISSKCTIKDHCDEEGPSSLGKNCHSLISGSVPYGEIARLFAEICVSLPKPQIITEHRKELMSKCWYSIGANLDVFKTLFSKAEHAKFLTQNSSGWKASFDWLLDPDHANKIIEGSYDILYYHDTAEGSGLSKPGKANHHNFIERDEDYSDLIRQYYEE